MSQAESDPTGFAAFATFLGTPLPENPIRALRVLRHEAAREIERLIDFLDRLGGDPDLEDGADAEPTLGWPAGNGRLFGSNDDGEVEPSLGWTGIVNQASRNRLGDGEDYEQDDADREESDFGEDDGTAESEPDLEPDHDTEEAVAPSLEYVTALRARRGQPVGCNIQRGFNNVSTRENLSLVIIGPDGSRQEIDRLGYPVPNVASSQHLAAKATTTSLLAANRMSSSDLVPR